MEIEFQANQRSQPDATRTFWVGFPEAQKKKKTEDKKYREVGEEK